MTMAATERILLIADHDRQIAGALKQAVPSADVTAVPSFFDGLSELAGGSFTTVLAAAAPIERRPERAVQTLREMAGDTRVLLFGHPTLEPLSRKMLDFGADDYLITPVNAVEFQQLFGRPRLRLANGTRAGDTHATPHTTLGKMHLLSGLPLADILLDALANHPHDARNYALAKINERLAPVFTLFISTDGNTPPTPPDEFSTMSHIIRADAPAIGTLHLHLPVIEDQSAARHSLASLSSLFSKLATVQETHRALQRLVMTDELTGVYNGRYFKHFLNKICEKALSRQFSVTLLLFDIDNFKKYNDDFGHGVGDEILRQTASVMRECCREHDVVARISGDEFAVVFWDKEGPRQPRSSAIPTVPVRPPQTPEQVFQRFRRKIASPDIGALGSSGQGVLTISAGLAAFPWEARTPDELIELADKRMMFGAKKAGKNTLFLVGGNGAAEPTAAPEINQ